MTTTADLRNTTLSGLPHIDALLDSGPDWNYLNPGGNVIRYTFSVSSGNERDVTGQEAFNTEQQQLTRDFLNGYLSALTGINFVETDDGAAAQLHLSYLDIADSNTSGLASWYASSSTIPSTGQVVAYSVDAYIYLDNNQFAARNRNLVPGSQGFETLLHELGHVLGLKHPFDANPENSAVLPFYEDSSNYTLMSYIDVGGPYSVYSPYDVAALMWLYGGDGLGGALGVGSISGARYVTGSANDDTLTGTGANDTLRGMNGNDNLNGGAGDDTAVYSGPSSAYLFRALPGGGLRVSGPDGTDLLDSIENLLFSNGNFRSAELADSYPPPVPSQSVAKNPAGYVAGNTPYITGITEAFAAVKVYNSGILIGSGTAGADGLWGVTTVPLADGTYSVDATATDAAGNVSPSSAGLAFIVDATPPRVPTVNISTTGGSNQPTLSGTAEAGTLLHLVNLAVGQAGAAPDLIAQLVVGSDGNWSLAANPLPDASYQIRVQSIDIAGNATGSAGLLNFTVESRDNVVGNVDNNTLAGTSANNAISGMGGIDTAQYSGARGSYTIDRSVNGHTVSSAADGLDSLIGMERIQFGDASVAIDVDGHGGQAYRLYRAAFDRVPDLAGVGFWIAKLDQGVSLAQAAAGFLASSEYNLLYGVEASNFTFVSKLYEHVLHRPSDGAGFDFWMSALQSGVSRAEVLVNFSESNENALQVIAQIQNGFEYIPFSG